MDHEGLWAAGAIAMLSVGCIWNPPNRTNQQSTSPIALSGYTANPGETFVLTVDGLGHFDIVSNPLVWSQFVDFTTSLGLPSPGVAPSP